MGIDYDSTLVVGYIIDVEGDNSEEKENKVDELCKKLKCTHVSFNSGYDTPPEYALVPEKAAHKIDLSNPDLLPRILNEIKAIKDRADALGIKLPAPVITSKIHVW
jgi:hypothetical protein